MKDALKFIAMLLAVYAFVSWNDARAEAIAQSPNKIGGSVILFDRQGVCSTTMKTVITRAKDGTTVMGCWYYADGLVFVKWSDGDVRTYPIEAFAPVKRPAQGEAL